MTPSCWASAGSVFRLGRSNGWGTSDGSGLGVTEGTRTPNPQDHNLVL